MSKRTIIADRQLRPVRDHERSGWAGYAVQGCAADEQQGRTLMEDDYREPCPGDWDGIPENPDTEGEE